MEVVLDENGLLEYMEINVAKPPESDSQNLAQWKKDVAKVRRIMLKGMITLSQISMENKLHS